MITHTANHVGCMVLPIQPWQKWKQTTIDTQSMLTINAMSLALGVTDFLSFLCDLSMFDFSAFVITPVKEQTTCGKQMIRWVVMAVDH